MQFLRLNIAVRVTAKQSNSQYLQKTVSLYNHGHNIWNILQVFCNFSFTTSSFIIHYFKHITHIRVASRVAERLKTQDLRKLGNQKAAVTHMQISTQNPGFLDIFKTCQFSANFLKKNIEKIFDEIRLSSDLRLCSNIFCPPLSMKTVFFILLVPGSFKNKIKYMTRKFKALTKV